MILTALLPSGKIVFDPFDHTFSPGRSGPRIRIFRLHAVRPSLVLSPVMALFRLLLLWAALFHRLPGEGDHLAALYDRNQMGEISRYIF